MFPIKVESLPPAPKPALESVTEPTSEPST